MPLLCVGLSHRSAPIEIRERLTLSPEASGTVLDAQWASASLRDLGLGEVALLSTCNRTELYAATPVAERSSMIAPDDAVGLLARACDVDPGFVAPFVYRKHGSQAVGHLCAVAAGLDSLVPGEAEVLGQVAEAHERAERRGAAGPVLRAAFQTAVRAGRRARAETAFGRLPASVASEGVAEIESRFPELARCRVAVIGTGRMARAAAGALAARGVRELRIVGRSHEHTRELAAAFGAREAAWHELADTLREIDAAISTTGAPHAVITRELIESVLPLRPAGRPLLLGDIAVPRDVEPSVGRLPGVELRDLDHLQAQVEVNLGERRREIPQVERIIAEEVAHFEDWRRGVLLRPVLAALHARAEAIRQREMARTLDRLGGLSPELRGHLEAFSSSLVAKLLDRPSRRLRSAPDTGRAEELGHALRELFDLADPDPVEEP
jgi:glutamyl-tRNA reductase